MTAGRSEPKAGDILIAGARRNSEAAHTGGVSSPEPEEARILVIMKEAAPSLAGPAPQGPVGLPDSEADEGDGEGGQRNPRPNQSCCGIAGRYRVDR